MLFWIMADISPASERNQWRPASRAAPGSARPGSRHRPGETIICLYETTDAATAMRKITVAAGSQQAFGINHATRSLGFGRLACPQLGNVVAHDRFWEMSNYSANATFVVENIESGSELIKIRPRRIFVPIPFEMTRVSILENERVHEFHVHAPEPLELDKLTGGPAVSIRRVPLDTASKYFLVLVALCEPKLRGFPMAPVPSVQDVVRRLRSTTKFRNANRNSVNYHIDYLVKVRLKLVKFAALQEEQRLYAKREALVSFAMRHDLVKEEHLSLLP